MDFTSRQLRAFLLVAEYRSFTRAAEALFITPPGLSMLIRELEGQLGIRLFNRTTRRVELTAVGNELLATMRRTLDALDETIARARGSASETTRTLSLGVTPLVASHVLPLAIARFRVQHPDFRFQLFDGDRLEIVARVEAGVLDIGMGVFFTVDPGIRRTPLFSFSLMIVRRADTRRARKMRAAPIPWTAIAELPIVSLPPSNPIQQLINKRLSRAKVIPSRTLFVNYLETQIAMVEAGEGVAIIPSFALSACRKRRVVVSNLIDPVVTLDFDQIQSPSRPLSASADDFASFFRGYITRWARRQGVLFLNVDG